MREWVVNRRPLLLTLVCSGPYLNLISDIYSSEFENLMVDAILTLPTIVIAVVHWCWYLEDRKYLKQLEDGSKNTGDGSLCSDNE